MFYLFLSSLLPLRACRALSLSFIQDSPAPSTEQLFLFNRRVKTRQQVFFHSSLFIPLPSRPGTSLLAPPKDFYAKRFMLQRCSKTLERIGGEAGKGFFQQTRNASGGAEIGLVVNVDPKKPHAGVLNHFVAKPTGKSFTPEFDLHKKVLMDDYGYPIPRSLAGDCWYVLTHSQYLKIEKELTTLLSTSDFNGAPRAQYITSVRRFDNSYIIIHVNTTSFRNQSAVFALHQFLQKHEKDFPSAP